MQVQQQSVAVNGTKLFCERAGSGDTVVLVHGGGGDRRHWDDQFAALAEHYDVLRYDLRGYGKSDNPVEGEPYRHEDDLNALLGELGIAKAHIAGYSLGCQVVVDTYTVYPDRFASIIAVGPYVSGHLSDAMTDLFGGYAAIAETFRESGARAAAEQFVSIPAFYPDRIGADAKARLIESGSDYSWYWADHNDPLESVTPPGAEVLAGIKVPMLIISADYDAEVCREVADMLVQQVPNNSRVDIAGATHFMLMEQPQAFNQAVLDFLGDATNG